MSAAVVAEGTTGFPEGGAVLSATSGLAADDAVDFRGGGGTTPGGRIDMLAAEVAGGCAAASGDGVGLRGGGGTTAGGVTVLLIPTEAAPESEVAAA
jgi:hypothetical protein